MAYLTSYSPDDRDIFDFELQGGKRVEIDMISDGSVLPRGRIINGATLGFCFNYGIEVPAELLKAVPVKLVLSPKSDGHVPDFLYEALLSGHIVSARFKRAVEDLEPNTHQFIEIQHAVECSGKPLDRQYYFMNTLTRLDAVIDELSDVETRPVGGADPNSTYLTVKMGLGRRPKLVLRKTTIESRHVWCGTPGRLSSSRFFSDELYDKVIADGLSPLWYRKCEEV